MATVKKGMLTPSPEWWKHLRWRRRAFWKTERRAAKGDAESDAAPAKIVWRRETEDGRWWVEVGERSDGLFCYTEWRLMHAEDDGISGSYDYTAPFAWSGLYATLNDAVRDAEVEIKWLVHARAAP